MASCLPSGTQTTVSSPLQGVRQESERIERLEQAIREAVPDWSLAEMVTAVQAMQKLFESHALLGMLELLHHEPTHVGRSPGLLARIDPTQPQQPRQSPASPRPSSGR